jgi:hypothetical protein
MRTQKVFATKVGRIGIDATFDTVSYAKAPSSASIGDHNLGLTIDLAISRLNSGWAAGDIFVGVERITHQHEV